MAGNDLAVTNIQMLRTNGKNSSIYVVPKFPSSKCPTTKKTFLQNALRSIAGLKTGLFITQELTGKNHYTKNVVFH